MISFHVRTFLLVIFLICHGAVSGQLDEKLSAKHRTILDEASELSKVMGIASGLVVGDQRLYFKAGYADENKSIDFTPNTITRIASVAKPMTAVAIMRLVEDGLVDLDAPIQTYVTDWPVQPEGEVTVRQVMGHFSGISAYQGKKEINNTINYPTLSDASMIFRDRPLDFAPGTDFGYTTYGYVLLGLVIEKASGMSYGDYMQQHIFEPANMSNTSLERAGEFPAGKSHMFQANGKGKLTHLKPTDLSDRIPGGGIQSTVEDVLNFGSALINGKLISLESMETLFLNLGMKRGGNGYGLGFYLYGINPIHGNVAGHTGGQQGCSAQFFVLPEKETVVFVVSNTSNAMDIVSPAAIALFDLIP